MRSIRMGVPEMDVLWDDLTKKADNGLLKGATLYTLVIFLQLLLLKYDVLQLFLATLL